MNAGYSFYSENGALDSFLISKCTPELEHYIGLEPDKPSFDELSEAMTNFMNIKVKKRNKYGFIAFIQEAANLPAAFSKTLLISDLTKTLLLLVIEVLQKVGEHCCIL